MNKPLADRIRPTTIDDVVGQQHILGKGKILRNIIESGKIPNMIFYGLSGTGKTTVANIAANTSHKALYRLNATNASVADVKAIVKESEGLLGQDGVLLYLDEIQNFNKKQQQSLLEYTENGRITLIASTTENPYFCVYNAILSRSTVFEFKALLPEDIEHALKRALDILQKEDFPKNKLIVEDGVLRHMAEKSGGDLRKALNALELAANYTIPDEKNQICLTMETAQQCTQKKVFQYDKDGDSHYDILSAFQKSIRGSDPDAAVHYLARLIAADDIQSICRRLMVIACEDVGLAYPSAITIVKACVDSALMLGFPEARIPLAQAVILLATAPKSNASYMAINSALYDLEHIDTGTIPRQLQNKHYDGEGNVEKGQNYLYPHDYPNHYVPQQYLPDKIRDKIYYVPGNNKQEQAAKEYWDKIKKK
ncbi:replication-associated recombination protein A [Ructibacterium gallinarum]|uniref:Replication-associated recombination protein A n=1 Tax=Ructibacterium gallinarum TaxID=2779355 RepID=A0A9D5M1U7_9FIRM|nr:replication-associated recombination protein A [Ructibacterium gallinarum]MBE5041062.1 replication-associated recombination protein A [Ructibacterium gallinarum]